MASIFERFGGYYNGSLNELRVRATYRANQRLAFSFSEQWNKFHPGVTEGTASATSAFKNFFVVFGSLDTDYAFSRFLSVSMILQMDTANTQAASANIRLRWNYRPDSDLCANCVPDSEDTQFRKTANLTCGRSAIFHSISLSIVL